MANEWTRVWPIIVIAIEITTALVINSIIFSSANGINFAVILNLAPVALFSLIPLIVIVMFTWHRVPLRDATDASIIMYAVVTTILLYNVLNDIIKIIGLIILIVGMYFRYIPLALAGLCPVLFTITLVEPLMVVIMIIVPLALWIVWRHVYKDVFDIGSLFIASAILLFYYSLNQDQPLDTFIRYGATYIVILLWTIINKMFPNILGFRENLKYGVLSIKKELGIWLMVTQAILNSIAAIKGDMLLRVVYEVLVCIICYSIYSSESKNTKFFNDITMTQNYKTIYSISTSI